MNLKRINKVFNDMSATLKWSSRAKRGICFYE
jgi:hypothetical protein